MSPFYDERGSKIKEEQFWDDHAEPLPMAFVMPKKGTYRIRITAVGAAGGSYTFRTEQRTPAKQVTGITARPTVQHESRRLARLVRDVSGGRVGAVDRFWAEAKARGGPLVETDGNVAEVLVTFVWKEVYETHNVFLVWPGGESQAQDHYMSRVPNTDVWYKTVRVLPRSRFSYQLAPNDRGDYPHETAQTDPLNPRLFTLGDRSNAFGSTFELPGAPDESWYRRTPSIRGRLTKHTFESAFLKGQRNVSVYTPPGYTPSKGPYALLILFDGPLYTVSGTNTLDNLLAAHRIRPTVVCFVSNGPSRNADLGNGPDNRDLPARQTYAAAIATELVPWLRSMHAVSQDPKDIVIGGHSAGAGAAAFTALNYPTVFGNVLSQSVGVGRLVQMAIDAPNVPVRFYLDVGLYEGGDEALSQRRRARDVLKAKGYEVLYRETAGGHESLHFWATLAEGLIALLGPPAK